MNRSVGFVLYVIAVVITVVVVAAKYFGVSLPPVTEWAMRDPAQSLLIALALSFIARFI
jgi:Mg/Co/Ni transporter MgtE